jgi:speckle-type POZ protein
MNHTDLLDEIFRKVVDHMPVLDGFLKYSKPQAPTIDFDPKSEVTKNFVNLFESRKFSDFTIRVAGRDVEVHKNILFTRSSVFGAMLSHDTVETSRNVCEIKDFDYETIYEIIRFIYCRHVENLWKMALKLLPAADKVR